MVTKAAGTPGIPGYRGQPGQKGEPLAPSASCAPGKAISRDVHYFRVSVDLFVRMRALSVHYLEGMCM